MPSFDKFMKDIEKRAEARRQKAEAVRANEEASSVKERIRRYSERWQNRIRYGARRSK